MIYMKECIIFIINFLQKFWTYMVVGIIEVEYNKESGNVSTSEHFQLKIVLSML